MLPGAGILGAIGRIASKHAKVVSQVLGTRSPHKKHSGKISSEPNMIAAENGSDQEDMDTKEGMFEVYVVLLFVVCLQLHRDSDCNFDPRCFTFRFKPGFKRLCNSEGVRRCSDGRRYSKTRRNSSICSATLFQTEGNSFK